LLQCVSGFSPIAVHTVETSDGDTLELTTHEFYSRLAQGERSFDVSYLKGHGTQKFNIEQPTLPTSPTHQKEVEAINELISIDFMYEELTQLTQFWNRFYTSNFGVNAAEWIYSEYQEVINQFPSDGIIRNVQFFNHTWKQPSVIASIEGIGPNKNQRVIIGAHLDSVNWDAENQDEARAPGACDDGGGTVTVMGIFRALTEAGVVFNRTIEFHHYAAEEVGLLGSQDIASSYVDSQIQVAGYLNFDMDAKPGSCQGFVVFQDYTDPDLNNFLIQLIETYSSLGYTLRNCGYACSDHGSWYKYGYRDSYAGQNGPYPNIHSAEDQIQYLYFPYVLQFAHVGAGFLVEIASVGEI